MVGLKRAKVYRSCSELPVRVFFRILETGDVSPLCYQGKTTGLDQIWERIVQEYEALTDAQDYTQHLNSKNRDLLKVNRITALVTLYYLMAYEPDGDYKEYLRVWNVRGDTKEAVRTQILQERTKYEINQLKAQGREKMRDVHVQPFEEIKAVLELALGKNYIDPDRVTVKEWVYYCKLATQKAKQINRIADGNRANHGE